MDDKKFKFALGDKVRLALSAEHGEVIARAEFTNCGNQYTVRYVDGHGVQRQVWFDEDALALPNT